MSDYSYDQGEENWLNDLLGRGNGDGDIHPIPGRDIPELEIKEEEQ